MPAATSNAIERDLQIAASPETVFGFLTDAKKMTEWMGREAWLDARPGGLFRVDYNGFDIARGEYIEVVPHSRVVFSWGWETLAADGLRPGASRVEITLAPDAGGTRLRLVHSGLDEASAASHSGGWDRELGNLVTRIAGGTVAAPPPLAAGEAIASQLNTLLVQLVDVVEGANPAAWTRPVPDDGRPANVVARHIVQHLGLVRFGLATAAGVRAPQADWRREDLDGYNAAAAKESAGVTQADVLAAARAEGPAAVEALKGIDGATLTRAQPMAFAGGAPLTAQDLLQGPLIGDIAGHLAGLRSALAG